jgi:hypothetical protein
MIIVMTPFIYAFVAGMMLLGWLLRAVHELVIGACAIAIVLIPLELVIRLVNIIYPI